MTTWTTPTCPSCDHPDPMYVVNVAGRRYRCGRCGIHAVDVDVVASKSRTIAAEALDWLRRGRSTV